MNIKIAIISCLVGSLLQAMEIDDSQGTIRKWDDLVEQTEDSDTSVITGEPFTKRSRIEKDDLISPDWDGMPAEIKQIILGKLLSVQDPFKTYKQLHELRRLSRDMNDQSLAMLKGKFLADQAQAMIETDKTKAGDLFVKSVEFDNDLMQLLIDKGVDVCHLNQKMQRRAMDVASCLGHMDLVEALLNKGAHFNKDVPFWESSALRVPLHLAVENGHTAIAEKLLAAGAIDVFYPGKLLVSAVILRKVDTVTALLDKGISRGWNVAGNNVVTAGCNVALTYAVIGGDIAIVQLLLDCPGSAVTNEQLMLACQAGKTDIVKLLLKHGARVNHQNKNGQTPLIIAVQNGHKEIAQMLIEANADLNLATTEQVTALHWASSKGFAEIAELLLAHGAEVNSLTTDGWTALMLACQRGHLEVAQALLDAHAHIHITDADKAISLVAACGNGHLKTAQLLLAHGADVNGASNNNLTSLLFAVHGGYRELVELLLEHGADIHAKTADGNTALMIAKNRKDSAMVKLIKENLKS